MNNLKDLFLEVYNQDGTVKKCGREKCKELIKFCNEKFPELGKEYFGNEFSGKLNLRSFDFLNQELLKKGG